MSFITVTLDTDLAVLLQELNQPIQETAREMIVLELYRRGSISSGKAASIIGHVTLGIYSACISTWALLSLISMRRNGNANNFRLVSSE